MKYIYYSALSFIILLLNGCATQKQSAKVDIKAIASNADTQINNFKTVITQQQQLIAAQDFYLLLTAYATVLYILIDVLEYKYKWMFFVKWAYAGCLIAFTGYKLFV
jgi:hypothetical protein